jgi:uncharacterized protein YndB with AHSA1/START domain
VPYNFTLTTLIPASPQEVYDAWLDSITHSAMTGGEAIISDAIGGEVSAFDGYITGRNIELVPGERIVQSWRTTQFEEDHEDSILMVTFEDADGGALLTLVHANVPDEQTSYERGGWEEYYFEPMKTYFSKLKGRRVTKKAGAAVPKAKRKGATKKTTKVKRRAATAAKAVTGKKKPKKARVAAKAAKAKAKRAIGAKRRPPRRASRR